MFKFSKSLHRFTLASGLAALTLAASVWPILAQPASGELIPNGDLEKPDGWEKLGKSIQVDGKNQVLKLTEKNRLEWTPEAPVKAGEEYVFSYRVKADKVQLPEDKGGVAATKWQSFRLVLWAQEADKKARIGKPIFLPLVRGSADWQTLEKKFVMPEGAANFTLFFDFDGGVGGTVMLDDLSLRPADGSAPATQVAAPKAEAKPAPAPGIAALKTESKPATKIEIAAPIGDPKDVLLIANYTFEPDAANPKKIVDAGPLGLNGEIIRDGVAYAQGRNGQGLKFTQRDDKVLIKPTGLLDRATRDFTISAWVKLDALPKRGEWAAIATKRTGGTNAPFSLGIGDNGQLLWQSFNGLKWANVNAKNKIKVGEWTHVAATFQNGGEVILWVGGEPVARREAELPMQANEEPLVLGFDSNGRGALNGTLDDLHLYATALSAAQIKADANGVLPDARAATPTDLPVGGYPVKMTLARFDMPQAFRAYDGRRLQDAKRVAGPNAVDWPSLKLNGTKTLFAKGPTEIAEVKLLSQGEAKDWFKTPKDNTISPINHWFRANDWLWGRKFVYTTDRTARTNSAEYELWTFPIKISGALERVELKLDGQEIYQRAEKLDSLTLLLPANLNGSPYELSVNGNAPVKFDVGLKPIALGKPEDEPMQVDLTVAGTQIKVQSLQAPPEFPQPKAWEADLKAMADYKVPVAPAANLTGFGRYLGLSVPRSPVGIFTTSMRAGMSGGHYFSGGHIAGFEGTPDQYAAFLKTQGYDFAFENAEPKTLEDGDRWEAWLAAMARQGLRAGANPNIPGNLGILSNPNLAFHSSFLPEWGAPAYRNTQLLTQRSSKYPNFAGLLVGADNAGYVPYWDWAPTIPDRPWGRAFVQFQSGHDFKVQVGPGNSPSKSYEKRGTQREFLDYIARYDQTFARYGYFARAVQEADPNAILTTGSYGSSPGGGGRGGWPWATIPASMNASLPVQTVYDWNEHTASKPLHNVAMVDRLQSTFPDKPTWALLDDFALFTGREARQRGYALALTRGVAAVGTNFLAHETGDQSYRSGQITRFKATPRERPAVVKEQRELYNWIHKYSGAYQNAKPLASIGVLYVHEQAISRPIITGDTPKPDDLLKGSHEGKTTEALFLCHQAGWPARIVTPAELKRGMPPEMKTILLVGLNRFDKTWLWSDGIEGELKKFVAGGGRLISDSETVTPDGLNETVTAMQVAAYTSQTKTDISPELLERNADNAKMLQGAMNGAEKPIAVGSDTLWAVPHQNGDTQYVTVVNWAFEEDKNASVVVKPQSGKLVWNTNRPIYDVQTGKKLTLAEAGNVDLTKDGFRLYALPPRDVAAPSVTTARGADGFWMATISTGESGVPVQLTIAGGGESATLFGSSGVPIKVPVGPTDNGTFDLSATELLTNQKAGAKLTATPQAVNAPDENQVALTNFAARKNVPLVVALTPAQKADPQMAALAKKVADFYVAKGRKVEMRTLATGDVVTSLQPLKAIQQFPQWRTIEADLILFGTPQTNVLLLDQARGGLLDGSGAQVTFSPFVGEYQALNFVGEGAALEKSVTELTR